MKSISQFRLKKLIFYTEVEQERGSDFPEHAYASFLFKDRVTNSSFKFKEAIQNDKSQIDLKQWAQNEAKESPEFAHALRTYKFAKKFEMNCIRNKYLEKKNRQSAEKIVKIHQYNKEQPLSVRNTQLFKPKADNMKKVNNDGGHSQNDSLGTRREKVQRRREKKTTKLWKRNEVGKQQTKLGEKGEITYNKAITHLKYEMKERGEYLLNVPTLIKRRNIIKQQFKHNNSTNIVYCEEIQKQTCQNKSPLKAVIQSLQFSPFNKDQYKTLRQKISVQKIKGDNTEFLRLVRLGYLNQVLIEIEKQPSIASIADHEANNAFHICVKKANEVMCHSLLKNLPFNVCYKLLQGKNHLGRTPLQIAQSLRQKEILKVFIEYLKEKKVSFSGINFFLDHKIQQNLL